IDNGKKIWWDVRTHYMYDTVEIRICDMPTNLDHTVALVQALMAKLYLMYRRNTGWRKYSRALIEENKWRALRYGSDAQLIDFGMQMERPFPELMKEMVELVTETTEIFGTAEYMKTVLKIASEGTSAHRQVEVYEKHGGEKNNQGALTAVVDHLIAETMRGIA
ncbi:MAG TPA: glutamate-cysteine ligase family protein, partial [Myxococcaceae bacterium]